MHPVAAEAMHSCSEECEPLEVLLRVADEVAAGRLTRGLTARWAATPTKASRHFDERSADVFVVGTHAPVRREGQHLESSARHAAVRSRPHHPRQRHR